MVYNSSWNMVIYRRLFLVFRSSIIHSAVCLTRDPLPLPRRVLHRVRANAASFTFQYPLYSLRSSSICLHFLSRLPVTYIIPSTFSSIKCFIKQFQHKMWTIQLSFLLDSLQHYFISFKVGLIDLFYPSPAAHFKTWKEFLIYFPKCQISAQCKAIIQM
jgi:hypothetical protein